MLEVGYVVLVALAFAAVAVGLGYLAYRLYRQPPA